MKHNGNAIQTLFITLRTIHVDGSCGIIGVSILYHIIYNLTFNNSISLYYTHTSHKRDSPALAIDKIFIFLTCFIHWRCTQYYLLPDI